MIARPARSLAGALLIWLATLAPAQAAVTITFWSHEFGNDFPHAFFTLRGVPDAGGSAVDLNYGFTAKAVTPALLFGTVPGRLDIAKHGYIEGSDAQFSVVMTDAQYADILALVREWDDKTGDGHYNLNKRNCVDFVKEAARRVGLTDLNHPKLMKRPRSYLQTVEAANTGHLVHVGMHGRAYLAMLAPLPATAHPSALMAPGAALVPAGVPAAAAVPN